MGQQYSEMKCPSATAIFGLGAQSIEVGLALFYQSVDALVVAAVSAAAAAAATAADDDDDDDDDGGGGDNDDNYDDDNDAFLGLTHL